MEGLRRATLEVEVDGVVELVALALRDGEWSAVSSAGNHDGAHVQRALRILGISTGPESPRSLTEPPVERARQVPPLCRLIDELSLAVVRAGVKTALESPSVTEALAALREALPSPAPLGIGRAIGRLREGLAQREAREVARVLDGLTRLSQSLREEMRSSERVRSWLGSVDGSIPAELLGAAVGPGGRKNLSDRRLLEVGRGWLSGFERRAIQRRFLLCLRSGAVYREEFDAHAMASAGPSPRVLQVGLAGLHSGPEPSRIRLMQYEVVPRVDREVLAQTAAFARRDFSTVVERYRDASKAYPALSEPFVLLAGERYEGEAVVDREGRRVALGGVAGTLARWEAVRARAGVRWVAGSLRDVDGAVELAVHSACVERDSGLAFERLV